MADVWQYDPVAANNQDPAPNGWPENLMLPSEVNDTGREMQAAQARELADINGTLTTGGFSDAYTLTLNRTSVTAYFNGLLIGFTAHTSNAEQACTLNVNGIGAAPLVSAEGNAPRIITGTVYQCVYDAAQAGFQLISPDRAPNIFFTVGTSPPASSFYTLGPADIDGSVISIANSSITLEIDQAGYLANGERVRIFNTSDSVFNLNIVPPGNQTFYPVNTSDGSPGSSLIGLGGVAYTLIGLDGDIVVAQGLL